VFDCRRSTFFRAVQFFDRVYAFEHELGPGTGLNAAGCLTASFSAVCKIEEDDMCPTRISRELRRPYRMKRDMLMHLEHYVLDKYMCLFDMETPTSSVYVPTAYELFEEHIHEHLLGHVPGEYVRYLTLTCFWLCAYVAIFFEPTFEMRTAQGHTKHECERATAMAVGRDVAEWSGAGHMLSYDVSSLPPLAKETYMSVRQFLDSSKPVKSGGLKQLAMQISHTPYHHQQGERWRAHENAHLKTLMPSASEID
jgi:hypothetical protein